MCHTKQLNNMWRKKKKEITEQWAMRKLITNFLSIVDPPLHKCTLAKNHKKKGGWWNVCENEGRLKLSPNPKICTFENNIGALLFKSLLIIDFLS